jgi:hypothetical protein
MSWRRDADVGAPLRALVVGLAILLSGSCQQPLPGIRVEFKVEDAKFRPDWVRFQWLRPGRVPVEERLPESGDLAASNDAVIGTLFVQTVGPLREARALAASGMRGDKIVSGGWITIEPSTGEQRRFQLILAEPLPDRDRNGTPDVVDDNCFPGNSEAPCVAAPDGGAVADGGGPAPVDAGGTSDGMVADAGAIDAGPSAEGLIGFWRFEEGTGTKTADSSGNGNIGTLRGADLAWVAGRGMGQALEIPNSNNHGVTVNASPSIDAIRNAFTIAAWIYRTEERDGVASILMRRSTGVSEYFGLALTADGMPRAYLNTHLMPAPPTLTGPDPIPVGQWVHLAMTYNGATLHLFANGTDIGNLAVSTTIMGQKSFLCIGCGQNADNVVTEPLSGRLDDLRLYQRALTAAEINLLAH